MASRATSSLNQSLESIWAQVHSPAGLPFPQTVQSLMGLGVTRYHVDYHASTATAYTSAGEVSTSTIPSHVDVSTIKARVLWNGEAVVAAIRKTQRGETRYAEFSRECIEAGVTNYFAFLEGKRVVYLGAEGDFHVEWFPGTGPKDK
jgi:uncharacterized protein YbcV (DUF1398 family)